MSIDLSSVDDFGPVCTALTALRHEYIDSLTTRKRCVQSGLTTDGSDAWLSRLADSVNALNEARLRLIRGES